MADAREVWTRGQEIAEKLLQEFSDVPDYHQILGGILGNLGASMTGRDDESRARELLEAAVRHERSALDSNPQHPIYRVFLRTDYLRLARLAVRQGDYNRAAEVTRQAASLGFDTAADCQRAAFVLAECVTRVERDDQMADERKKELSETFATEATTLLRQAIDKGYRNLDALKGDLILQPLRPRGDFQDLLAELEATVRSEGGAAPR